MKEDRTIIAVYSPGGNITALAQHDDRMMYTNIARRIMESDSAIEQVGFLEPPCMPECDFHLEMMGGEFCGNAARCAALHFLRSFPRKNATFTVSGFAKPVIGTAESNIVTLKIPKGFFTSAKKNSEGLLIDFHGIRFLVSNSVPKAERRRLINLYCGNCPAMGIIEWERFNRGCRIAPWVWVKATNTFIAETACASGSLAAAMAMQRQGLRQPVYTVTQPSGSSYAVELPDQSKDYFVLSGEVALFSEREVKFAAAEPSHIG